MCFLLILCHSLAAESRDCFTENRSQASRSESAIGTRTSSSVNEDKTQLKFCAKSYLPARINSTALESISVVFQCRISHAQAYEKVTSPQLWESHAGLQCCFACLFSVGFSVFVTEPRYRLSDSARSSSTWAKFLPRVASFFFVSRAFCHSFFTSWCLAPRSNCWLTPKGASSEFTTLCVIFSGRKDEKKQVTKTTVDTFTARLGLSSVEQKACNYVYSLTVIQLRDYRDRICTCTSCWMPLKKEKSKKRGHVKSFHTTTICENNDQTFILLSWPTHAAALLDRWRCTTAPHSGNEDWTSAGEILCAPASDWLGKVSAVIMQLYEVAN